jgi:membrane protein
VTIERELGQPRTIRNFLALFRDSLFYWSEARAFLYAAALAFYTIFSIVPFIALVVGVMGQVAGAQEFEQRVVNYIAEQVGAVPGEFVSDIVSNGGARYQSTVATGLGLLFLLWGASSVFHMLQNSLNAMYGMPERYATIRHGILDYVITRLLAAFVVLILGFIFLALLVANLFFTALPQTRIEAFFEGFRWTHLIVRNFVVPVTSTLLLGALYKWLPGGRVRWRDVLPGAFITMLLIALGNRVLGFYLERIYQVSIYGASGTVVLFLVWIYYNNLILLWGAKFIALYAERYGLPVSPKARLLRSRFIA